MSTTAEIEVDQLFNGSVESRLDRLAARFQRIENGEIMARLDRLAARVKALAPLDIAERCRIIKRFQHEKRPGFSRGLKDFPMLELTTTSAALAGVDESEMSVRCIISTPSRDRVGDVLEVSGCDLSEYTTNPVVLWAHDDESFPIGKAEDNAGRCTVQKESNRIVATVFFIRGDARFEKCFDLIRRRFLRGVSVGFLPDAEPIPLPGGGNRYTRWVLYEFSFCTIPMNAEALVLADGAS